MQQLKNGFVLEEWKRRDSYLSIKTSPIGGFEKFIVNLIGFTDHHGNCILVLRGWNSQQGQGSQGDVVFAAAETALIVAVGI